jgi:hypothetical protein
MKNFTRSIQQVCYNRTPQTITHAVLLISILLATAIGAVATPVSGAGVNELPVVAFSQHPLPRTACANGTTTFSVAATGTGTLTYQWYVSTNGGGAWNPVANGSTYTNVNTASLSVLVATPSMNGYLYRCEVTDNAGTTPSNAALLTVSATSAPTVKTGNTSVSICANGGGSISAQFFSGLTYQWQVSTDNGNNWNNLTDVAPYSQTSTDMLVISSGATLDGNLYRYVATNTVTNCQAISGHDTLHVYQPVINTPPANSAVCSGNDAAFTVAASSPLALTYQWSRQVPPLTALSDGAPYSGTTTNTLTVAGVTTANNGWRYLVAVSDALGCVTTSPLVTLNVYNPLAINTHPRDTFACANTTINNAFRVTMSGGSQPVTYQWQTDNGTNGTTWSATNAPVNTSSTTSVLSLTGVTLSMNGYRYRLSITGTCGTIYSNEATLRVLADGTWRGTTNTDWHTATNWCGGVPTSTTDVLIPNWAPRMPIISANTAFSRSLHIENTARLTISGGTTAMSGPFNIEGTVAYTALGDQPVLPAAHGSLEINGSGNKYMQSSVDISHNLVLGGTAKLITDNNILTMKAGSSPVSGATFSGSVTSWIVTGNGNTGVGNTGLGGLRIEQIDGADGSVLYPVGATPAAYNPLQLTNTGTADHFTIAVNDQLIPGVAFQSGIDRTWQVSEATPGGSDIAIELRWAGPEELSQFDRTLTEVIRSDGTNIVQSSTTAAANGSNPYTRAANAFTILTQFSVASHSSLLPVKLSTFTVQGVDKTTARLNWKTDGRDEGGVFVIQKLTGATNFNDIGVVNQEAGKTGYTFTDNKLGGGITHYRLRITTPGQQQQYSKPVQINNPLTNHHIALRPSVTNKEQTSLYLNLSAKDRISITIFDMMGRVQLSKTAQVDKGEHYLPLQIGRLAKGIYYVRVIGSNALDQTLQLVKQ